MSVGVFASHNSIHFMNTTVELDLPQAIAEKAKAAGLLCGEVLSGLVERELVRHQARENFGAMLKQLRSVTGDELTPEEIQTEINAVRSQRQKFASS